MSRPDDHGFPVGFFARADESADPAFYAIDRFVTHLDPGAIAAVSDLYDELGLTGRVLDLCSSWVSHFRSPPAELMVLGLNERELAANPMATGRVVHDLNTDPGLPFPAARFDDITCCASVDYLVRPVEVFREVGRVLVPGGRFVVTFSNRCFPTKAIRGWLLTDDEAHVAIVAEYFRLSGGWGLIEVELRRDSGDGGDPLWAVWAEKAPQP